MNNTKHVFEHVSFIQNTFVSIFCFCMFPTWDQCLTICICIIKYILMYVTGLLYSSYIELIIDY